MADIVRWDPFGEMTELRERMDRLFDRGLTRPWRLVGWDAGEGLFPVDLYETDDEVVVKASLPGVKGEDVDISVTGDTLTIKGEAREETEEKKPNYYRQERRYGSFHRSFTLPVKVDAEKAEATFEDGVLRLKLPKVAEVRPKSIEVKAGKGKMIEGKTTS